MGFILSRFFRFHIALTAGNGEAKRKWNDWCEEEKRELGKRERQPALVFGCNSATHLLFITATASRL
jgi:hypothetical protein